MQIFFLIVILSVISAGFIGLFVYIQSEFKKRVVKDDTQSLLLLQNQINELARMMELKLGESSRAAQMGEHARNELLRTVSEHLTRLQESNKQVLNFTDQLKNLQDILKNPKQRGILGEYYLETVLKNVLPPGSYQMQYAFHDGTIVDAAVFVDKRVIPIDSKFSLENYNRILEARDPMEKKKYESALIADLKIRIEETSKYVKPEENTMDFAFMFIPSEAVYYDLLINKVGAVTDDTKNLITYAGQKRVIVVSPTSFLAYLQTVLQGLRNQKISEQAMEIIKQVENLGRHLLTYDTFFKKVGVHLSTTVSMYNSASKEFVKIDKDVLKITGDSPGVKSELVEAPNLESRI